MLHCQFVFIFLSSCTCFTLSPSIFFFSFLNKNNPVHSMTWFFMDSSFPPERDCSEMACSLCIATEGLYHMKIFCLKLKTLHNIILNTACSEQLMEGRHRENDDITTGGKKIGKASTSEYLENRFSTICHALTAPKKSPYIELQEYQEGPFESHWFGSP